MKAPPVENISPTLSEDFSVSRMPIFTNDMAIFTYQFNFFKQGYNAEGIDATFFTSTMDMIIAGLPLAMSEINTTQPLFLRIPTWAVQHGLVDSLPPENAIVEVSASANIDSVILSKISELRGRYQISVDNFSIHPSTPKLVALADYVKISLSEFPETQAVKIIKLLGQFKCKIIASNVDTWEQFFACTKLGFSYFQGNFFSKVNTTQTKLVKGIPAIKIRLIKELSLKDDELDVKKLAEVISLDPSLCVKLLKFINSASFCLPNKVDTISRAISFLGLRTLKQWATATLLSDIDLTDRGQEVMFLSLQRAFFLRLLAETGFSNLADKESFFMLGLLSLADAIFGIKMEDLISDLPLDVSMRDAILMRGEGGISDFVKLLKYAEANDWNSAGEILDRHMIPRYSAAKLYMTASCMSGEALENI